MNSSRVRILKNANARERESVAKAENFSLLRIKVFLTRWRESFSALATLSRTLSGSGFQNTDAGGIIKFHIFLEFFKVTCNF